MIISIIILALLIAVFYFSEKAKDEKRIKELIEKDNENKIYKLNNQLKQKKKKKIDLDLLLEIETFIIKNLKNVKVHNLSKRKKEIDRYLSNTFPQYTIENEFFKSELSITENNKEYSVIIYEELKQGQLKIIFYIHYTDNNDKYHYSKEELIFDDYINLISSEMFDGFKKIYEKCNTKLKEKSK